LIEDGATALFSWAEQPPRAYTMSAARVDEEIQALRVIRGNMLPAVAPTWNAAPHEPFQAAVNPEITIAYDAFGELVVMHVRDPGLGWLHVALTRNRARGLGQTLITAADAPPPAVQGRA